MQLLDLCKSTGVNVINKRLDEGQSFTYFSRIGSSVIDYMLMKPESFYYVNNFRILPFDEFSDHTPLQFSLSVLDNTEFQSNGNQENTFRFQSNCHERDVFCRTLIGRLLDMNHIIKNDLHFKGILAYDGS